MEGFVIFLSEDNDLFDSCGEIDNKSALLDTEKESKTELYDEEQKIRTSAQMDAAVETNFCCFSWFRKPTPKKYN